MAPPRPLGWPLHALQGRRRRGLKDLRHRVFQASRRRALLDRLFLPPELRRSPPATMVPPEYVAAQAGFGDGFDLGSQEGSWYEDYVADLPHEESVFGNNVVENLQEASYHTEITDGHGNGYFTNLMQVGDTESHNEEESSPTQQPRTEKRMPSTRKTNQKRSKNYSEEEDKLLDQVFPDADASDPTSPEYNVEKPRGRKHEKDKLKGTRTVDRYWEKKDESDTKKQELKEGRMQEFFTIQREKMAIKRDAQAIEREKVAIKRDA